MSNIGVFRTAPDGITGEFILDTNGDHIMDAGDETFTFGLGTDRIVIGDWNGGGKDEVGVFRDAVSFIPADVGDAVFSLDTNNNHTFDAGDQVFVFGLITDKVVIGDWNGNGVSKVGVYRDGSTASGAFSSARRSRHGVVLAGHQWRPPVRQRRSGVPVRPDDRPVRHRPLGQDAAACSRRGHRRRNSRPTAQAPAA